MAFDGTTYMTKKTALMTAAAALALWDNATDEGDKLAAGQHLADILRARAVPKAKTATKEAAPKLLTDLRAAMKVMVKQAPPRHTIPILNNVMLQARGDTLVLTGTDLDSMTTVEIDAPGIGTWETTVNAKDFAAALKTTGDVLMEADDANRLMVMVGGATSKFTGIPVGDFPVMGLKAGPQTTFRLPTAQLADMIGFVQHAISTEETRYYLNGLYMHAAKVTPAAERSAEHEAAFTELLDLEQAQGRHERAAFTGGRETPDLPDVVEARLARIAEIKKAWQKVEDERVKPDGLRVVTTDGHRLAMADGSAPKAALKLGGIIIPRQAIDLIQMVLSTGEEAEITVVEKHDGMGGLRLTVGNATITTKLIDGTFPDYTRVIPRNNDKVATFDRAEAAKAVKSVSSISKERTRSIRLDVGAKLALSARNMEGGQAEGAIPCERSGTVEDYCIGFNASYVLDGLAAYDGELVQLVADDQASPTLLLDPARSDRKVVLMPLRL